MATEKEKPVGFAGAFASPVRFQEYRAEVYQVSFVAVRPEVSGQGIAFELYSELLAQIAATGLPFVVFVIPHSSGERLLVRACQSSGCHLHHLGNYPGYGYPISSTVANERVASGTEALDRASYLRFTRKCNSAEILWYEPDEALLDHWNNDPRASTTFLVNGSDGEPVAAASLVLAPVRSVRGLEEIPIVNRLFLHSENAEALRALAMKIAAGWRDQPKSCIVSAPNLCGLEPEVVRAAGFRQTRARFVAYLGTHNSSLPLQQATRTNMMIV